ncbi:MAG: PilZ domain-containing protein [Candidatus Omnitrophota bacterium]
MDWDKAEKRRFVRANFDCKIIIHTPKEHIIISHTENIGVGGVRVFVDEKLNISSEVGLEIYLGQSPISCKGKIAWVVERADRFDTGIEFLEISEKDERVISNIVENIVS